MFVETNYLIFLGIGFLIGFFIMLLFSAIFTQKIKEKAEERGLMKGLQYLSVDKRYLKKVSMKMYLELMDWRLIGFFDVGPQVDNILGGMLSGFNKEMLGIHKKDPDRFIRILVQVAPVLAAIKATANSINAKSVPAILESVLETVVRLQKAGKILQKINPEGTNPVPEVVKEIKPKDGAAKVAGDLLENLNPLGSFFGGGATEGK